MSTSQQGPKKFPLRSSSSSLSVSSFTDFDAARCWPFALRLSRRCGTMDQEVVWSPPANLLQVSDTPAHRSLRRRSLGPLTAGGIRQSIFTLVQTALGGGVLTMAYMMRISGVGMAIVLLSVAALIANLSMQILMRTAVKLDIYTYSGLCQQCMGAWSGVILDIMLLLLGNGGIVAFFIFLGDFLPNIVLHFDFLARGHGAPCEAKELRRWCMLLCCLLAIPMTLPKNISALRHISPIALTGLFYTVGVVVARAPSMFLQHLEAAEFGAVRWFTWDLDVLRAFSICIFAYNCHLNVVPVASELIHPGVARICKVTRRVALVQWLVYLAIATGGYLSFLALTPQNLITAYPQNERAILLSRMLLSITLLACIPMNAHPSVRSMMQLLEKAFPDLSEQPKGAGAPLLLPVSESCEFAIDEETSTTKVPSESSEDSSTMKVSDRYPMNREGLRHLLSVVLIAIDLLIALNVEQVAVIVGILGASVGTLMIMVIPAMLLLRTVPDLYPPVQRWGSIAFLLAGSVASASSMFI